jgi:putrescine aminotransferase
MARSGLSPEEQREVVADCVTNFDRYVNPGILEYRKALPTDYTPVEWSDQGYMYRDIRGKEYIDCLGGFGKAEFREPFYPLVPGVRFVPYGDADALDKELAVCDAIGFDIAAFAIEPIQGEAGAIVPPADYFPKVREICDTWKILLIVNEVQTGMGRTGRLWGVDNWGVAPGIMTMGKALGGAVIPIGNFIATPDVFEAFFENPYIHSTTFSGTPMATSATIGGRRATLDEDIPGQAAEKGAHLKGRLEALAAAYPDLFEEVRGMGMIIGMQSKDSDTGHAGSQGLFSRGVLIGGTLLNSLTLRMQPPAVITYPQMDQVLERLEETPADVRKLARDGALVAGH